MPKNSIMQNLLDRYIQYLKLERNISPLTVRNYTTDIQGFFDFLDAEEIGTLDKVDRSVLRNYLGQLHNRGVTRGSINRKLSAVRCFYRYLEQNSMAGVQPLSSLSAPKLEKRLPSFLTHGEIAQLLEAPDLSTPQGLRDRAILELLYAAGLRVSELVSLNLSDINLKSREIRVWGKGSKERIALMGRPAAEYLELYLKNGRVKLLGSSHTEAVFLNRFGERLVQRRVQHIVEDYARQAGLNMRVFPHIIRHTFATHMLDGGADLRVVQDLLGHARLATTQVYTHVTRSQIRRSYLAAHPRSGARKGEL